MKNLFDQNVLITTDHWFLAQNGQQYKGVWGRAKVCKAVDLLGFNPRRSENWFVLVGEGDEMLMVGGCEISFVQACPKPPSRPDVLILKSGTDT